MKRFLLALFVALIPATGWGQATLLQGGSWSSGYLPVYSGSGGSQPIVQNSGSAAGGGVGIRELAVIARGTGTAPYAGQGTGPYGTVNCTYDGPTTGAHHYLCFSANAQGGGLIAFGAAGGAAQTNLNMIINGTTYQFPFTPTNSLTVGSTAIVGGTSNGLLYNNAGVLGNLAATANGTLVTNGSGVPSITPVNLYPLSRFGAVCDGVTDDRTAILSAFASGLPLTGNRLTCAVSGDLTIPAGGVYLQDVELKQLSPTGSVERRTLYYSSASNGPITLKRVTVNRNGSPTDSLTVNQAAGIWLAGTAGNLNSNIYLEDVEVYGDGPGIGIAVVYASNPRLIRPYVHDMRWQKTVDPCTEQVIGIWPISVTNGYIESPKVKNLTGVVVNGVPSGACALPAVIGAGVSAPYQTDGISVSAATGLTVANGYIENVSEGIDVSGSLPNTNVWLYGMNYYNNGAICEKWYHDPYYGGSVGSRCDGAGLHGLALGGSIGVSATGPRFIRITDFVAVRIGVNGYWTGSAQLSGIAAPETTPSPLSNQCVNCIAIGTGGAMKYGFLNHMGTANSLQIINPYVSGATIDDYDNFVPGALIFNANDGSLTLAGVTTFIGTNTVGALGGNRILTNTVSGTDFVRTSMRYDDNNLVSTLKLQNYGVTGINQGQSIQFEYGTGSSLGAIAGSLSFISTGDWSAAGTRSAEFRVECINGGALGTCLTVSSSLVSAPSFLQGERVRATTALLATQALPALSSCGTSPPAAVTGSSNNAGQFTTGTGTPSACTVTFANAFPASAFCAVTPVNAAAVGTTVRVSTQSQNGFTITLGAGTDSATYNYTCVGN